MKKLIILITCVFSSLFVSAQAQAATFEEYAVEYVNNARQAEGLPALAVNETLANDADIRAQEASVKLSHERPDGTPFYTVDMENVYGENLAEVNDLSYNEYVCEMWMNSASHKANIMGTYTEVGVGTYVSSSGNSYAAMLFTLFMDLKKPYTLDEQIKKLKDHGVVITDETFVKNVLQKVSYYRLSGYMLQYRLSSDSHEMIKGIRFEEIYTVYCFDEEIRSLLRQHIEKAEFFYKALIRKYICG